MSDGPVREHPPGSHSFLCPPLSSSVKIFSGYEISFLFFLIRRQLGLKEMNSLQPPNGGQLYPIRREGGEWEKKQTKVVVVSDPEKSGVGCRDRAAENAMSCGLGQSKTAAQITTGTATKLN